MNWVTKKLFLSKLRNYFHVDNQDNIQFSLLGKKQIKCAHLQLKPQVVNASGQLIHVESCYIKTLEVSYGANDTDGEPFQVKIDSVKLTLKFNQQHKVQEIVSSQKRKSRPVLEQFYQAVGSEKQYTERSFFQEEIHQLKRIFGEFFLSKIVFSITNIDVSVMCIVRNKPAYIGVKIGDIDFKQKIVSNSGLQQINTTQQDREMHGQLRNIGIYLGVDIQNTFNVKKQSAMQKQVTKRRSHRQKKYLMKNEVISIFYNFDEKHLSVVSKQLSINIEEILLFQLKQIADYVQKIMKIQPNLRPGEGKIKTIGEEKITDSQGSIYTKSIDVSEGTIQWWQVFGNMIIGKFNQRENLNVLKNKKFKRYLFCLLYRYTYGAKSQLEDIIDEYEFFKSDIQVIKYNRFIIERVHKIQVQQKQNIQCKGFMIFLRTVVNSDQVFKKIKLKTIKYNDIANSNVVVNLQNCKKFMRIYNLNQKDNINIDFRVNTFRFCINQSKQSEKLKSDLTKLTPAMFDAKKKDILSFYSDSIISNTNTFNSSGEPIEQIPNFTKASFTKQSFGESTFQKKKSSTQQIQNKVLLSFEIRHLNFEMNPENNLYFKFDNLAIKDHETNTRIAKITNFLISMQNMHPQMYKWAISVQQRLVIKSDLIFFHLDHNFIQKCLMIKTFITPPTSEQENDTSNFISKLIAKKVPQHRIFNSYTSMSKQLFIKECLITIPVLQKDRILEISTKQIEYNDPVNEKCGFSITQIFITRSSLENVEYELSHHMKKEKDTDKSILLVNTQPLSGYSNKSSQLDYSYLFVPFFLIQISCQDMYYFLNIMESLSRIFSNPYFFPPVSKVKQKQMQSEIKQTSIEFTKKMENENCEIKVKKEIKIQGIQLYFVTDPFFQSENKLFGVLIDSIFLVKKQKFLEDSINLHIKDIFIKNCLRSKSINKDQLIKSIKGTRNLDDESIIYNQKLKKGYMQVNVINQIIKLHMGNEDNQSANEKVGDLLFYTEERQKKKQEEEKDFLNVQIQSNIHLEDQKSITEVLAKIVPIFIFYNEKFFIEMLTIINVIRNMSNDTVASFFDSRKSDISSNYKYTGTNTPDTQRSTTYANEQLIPQESVEVLRSKQFEELIYLFVHLDLINVLMVKNQQVVMSVTIKQLAVKHKSQPYLIKFTYSMNRLTVMDTSEQAGPYPIIFDAQPSNNKKTNQIAQGLPLIGYYIIYNSQILRQKENKAAYLYLRVLHPEIFFLKKKILEFTNLALNFLNRTIFKNDIKPKNFDEGDLTEVDKKQGGKGKNKFYSEPKPNMKSTQPQFCYYIQLIEPNIRILRGSLSSQGFNAVSSHIFISNFSKEQLLPDSLNLMEQFTVMVNKQQVSLDVDITKINKTDKNMDRGDESFQSCSKVLQQNYENFQSFSKVENSAKYSPDTIYIRITDFLIEAFEHWESRKSVCNRDGQPTPKQVRYMVDIPTIKMQLVSPDLHALIPEFYGDLTDDDYRVLIRLTEDNFGEAPILFTTVPVYKVEPEVSFRTTFEFKKLVINMKIEQPVDQQGKKQKTPKKIQLNIDSMKGVNEIWTNNKIDTQFTILNMTFMRQDSHAFISNRSFDKHNQKLPEQPPSISYRNIGDVASFKELENLNQKIWKKFKQNQGKCFQLFKNINISNEQILNPQEMVKGHAVKETNTQKICKWVAGMCTKCFKFCTCCIKRQRQSDYQQNNKMQEIKEETGFWSEDRSMKSGQKNRNASVIYELGQVLDFEYKISEYKIIDKKQKKHMVYLNFLICSNGQKHMYMQAKDMIITVQNQRVLLDAVNFLNRPYVSLQIPAYVRIPKFNNQRPFKMVMEVNDSYMELKHTSNENKSTNSERSFSNNSSSEKGQNFQETQKEEKIIIQFDTIYDSQNKGDNKSGPGKSSLRIENIVKLLFISDRFPEPISLSDQFRAVYLVNETTRYGKNKMKKAEQKVFMEPYNTANGNTVRFKFPMFLVKAFQRIFQNSFPSKPDQSEPDDISQLSSQKEDVQQGKKLLGKFLKNKQNLQDVQQKKQLAPLIQQQPPKDIFVSRTAFIPQIAVEVQYTTGNSFLHTSIKSIRSAEAMFIQTNVDSSYKTSLTIRNIRSTVAVNYWNLKLGKFEPCIQPWSSKLSQIMTERDGVVADQKRIESDLSKQNIVDDIYYNDLNVNASVSLFQAYKQLMIKYEEEDNEDIEVCFDLSSIESKDCNLFSDNRKHQNQQFYKNDFPVELKSYFGRIFKTEEQYTVKRNVKIGNKSQFNPKQLKVYLYHSYFDHSRRKKRLTYRIPYRLFNSSNIDLQVDFLKPAQGKKDQVTWDYKLKKLQYYSIPQFIYRSDFFISFSELCGNKLKRNMRQPPKKFVSARYLLETRAKNKQFNVISNQSKVWKLIFKYSSTTCDKFLDQSDLLLSFQDYKLCVLSVKGAHKVDQDKKQITQFTQDNKLYDSYAIILSPIIIENYSYCSLQIKINRDLIIDIPSNQKIEINRNFAKNFYDTIFQFEQDNFHRQFQFLKFKEPRSVITMETDKLQSLNLIVYRQSNSTCQIQIYAEWNLENNTNHDFSLRFLDRLFLIDRTSFSYLSNIASTISISLVGEQAQCTRKIKSNTQTGNITLKQRITQKKLRKLEASKLQHQTRRCCSCINFSHKIQQNIQFVIKAREDQLFHLSKRVELKYKYQIRNLSTFKLKFFQHHEDFLIADISNFEDTQYIFFYDFIPKKFFLQLNIDQKKLKSCQIDLQKFPGTSFALKIKKNNERIDNEEYYNKFYYLRIQIKRNGQQTFIDILDVEFDNFPIYLDNLTDYFIKITENEQEFLLKPQQRIPFTWSQLLQQQNVLEVKIDNAPSKIYKFNKKQAFESIKLADKVKKKKKKNIQNLYKKEQCYISYGYHNINGVCMLILDSFDNKLRFHNPEDGINIVVDMEQISRMESLASKIEVYDCDNNLIQIVPSSKTIKAWGDALHDCSNENVIDRIYFTIESYKKSRFFFFRTIVQNDNEIQKQQVFIKSLNLSLISNHPKQILLINCEELSYNQQDKVNRLNYKNLMEKVSERVLTLKKLKVSNQISFLNPVILSQIKKSNTPFLELRLSRIYLLPMTQNKVAALPEPSKNDKNSHIVHYKQITVFMDEAEMMAEISILTNLMGMKNSIDHLTNQYAGSVSTQQSDKTDNQDNMINVSNKTNKTNNNKTGSNNRKMVDLKLEDKKDYDSITQLYINSMEIKPIKMTISVNMATNKQDRQQANVVGVLGNIPLDVQNAIIEINSFIFFHVFFDQEQFTKILSNYYYQEIQYQTLKNVGSYEMLAPIKIVEGLGVGVKNIFYDPFYQFVKKKQIQAVGKKICDGLISLIILLISSMIKLVDIVFKLIAALTFDKQFRNRRESFRKQIFKSPLDGAILGGKQFLKVFKSYFSNFTKIGENYPKNIMGYFCGFLISVISIIPWVLKLVVSIYDFFYVIGVGFVNWGYYEESAMKNRTRPPRTFQNGQLTNYNYRYSYAYQLIRKNNLEEIENQEIYFVKKVQMKDEYNYLILSNYRILYNKSKIQNCSQIKLYQIQSITATENQKKNPITVNIKLSIPNTDKILVVKYNNSQYDIQFSYRKDAYKFLGSLKKITDVQRLSIDFDLNEKLSKYIDYNYGLLLVDKIIVDKGDKGEQDKIDRSDEKDDKHVRNIMEEIL